VQLAKFLFCHRKALFGIAILVLLFSLAPFSFAQAGLGSTIANAITGAIAQVLSVLFGIVAFLLAGIFLAISTVLFAIIDYFLSSTVIPGGDNTPDFVEASFNLVLQFVNMFFILILVFIGLATILRLQTYELKKTLPLLLIMALLVNFSGVFVGFIVDMTNLPAHFFLEQAKGDWGDMIRVFNPEGSPEEKLGTQIASIIYFLVATLIYLVLIIVFAVRTMFLWLLTILAPLAFASYILPATRAKIWSVWWQNLIQWSLFVIPVTFFMFLAHAALTGVGNVLPEDPLLVNPDADGGIRFLRDFLAPFTALFILYIGVTVSQQMAPAAAKAVADFGQRRGMAIGKGLGSGAWRRLGGVGFGKLGQNIRRRAEGGEVETKDLTMFEKSRIGGATRRLFGWGSKLDIPGGRKTRTKKVETGVLDARGNPLTIDQEVVERQGFGIGGAGRFIARWAGRGMEAGAGQITNSMKAADETEIAEAKSEGTNKDAKDNILKINQELAKGTFANMNRIIGLLNGIVANGDSDDLQEALRDGILSGKRVGDALIAAQRGGPPSYRPLAKALFGRLLSDPEAFGSKFAAKRGADGQIVKENGRLRFENDHVERMINEVPEKLSAADITNKILGDTIDKGKAGGREFTEFGGEVVVKHLLSQRGGDLVGQLMRRPESVGGREAMAQSISNVVEHSSREIDDTTLRSLFRFFTSTGSRSLGLGLDIIERDQSIRNDIDAFITKYPPRPSTATPGAPRPRPTRQRRQRRPRRPRGQGTPTGP